MDTKDDEELKLYPLLRSPVASLVPPLVLMLCVGLWAVDVLNWDEWTIWTGVLSKLQAGTLSLADMVAQQNEQRNLAARLAGLLLLPVFSLNRLAECALNIGLAGGIFLLVRRLYAKTAQPGSAPAPLLAISLLSFSFLQWETFSVGANSSVLLPPLGMWAGAVLATPRRPNEPLGWARLGFMILAGLIPSFSFVNGLFFWFCLTPLVALNAGSRGQKLAKTTIFALAGSLVWAAYFHGYSSPPHHPSPLASLARPDLLLGYFLAYLGGGLVGDKNLLPLALLAGTLPLILLALFLRPVLGSLARRDWRHAWRDLAQLAPWLCVATFTLLSALATAAGRSSFGLGQALESRYATFSTPLWLVLISLYSLRGHAMQERARLWMRHALGYCLALFLLSSVLSAIVLHNRAPLLAEARAELFRCTTPQKLTSIFPDPAYVIRQLPLYLERRTAMYRDIKPLAAYIQAETRGGSFEIKPSLGVSGRVCGYLFSGRAGTGQAGLVLLVLPQRIAAVARSEADGRFELFVPDNALPADNCVLRAFSLAADGRTLRLLGPVDGARLTNSPCPPPVLTVDKYFHVR